MNCPRVVARCLHLFASDFRRWEKYAHAAPMVLLPSQSLQLTHNEFPIRDTFLSCPALFPFAFPFPFPFLFFNDTTCQPVRSMMIHGPFVICLISVDCLKQRVWKWSTRFSSLPCQIFRPSLLVFDFGPRSAKGREQKTRCLICLRILKL